MKPERITELVALVRATTKGAWVVGRSRRKDGKRWWVSVAVSDVARPNGKVLCVAKCGVEGDEHHEQSLADAEFIAASRQGILELVHLVQKQEQEINRLNETIDDISHAVAGR